MILSTEWMIVSTLSMTSWFQKSSKPHWMLSIFWEGATAVQWLSPHRRDSNQNTTSLVICSMQRCWQDNRIALEVLKGKREDPKSLNLEQREKKVTKEPTTVYYSRSQSANYKVFLISLSFSPSDFPLQRETQNKLWWKWRHTKFWPMMNKSNELLFRLKTESGRKPVCLATWL